jgi:hypothetical protein
MDQRIRDFELLWNALFHRALVPPPPRLVRSTCEHWTLPEAELERWFAAPTVAERDAILAANRTERRYSWNEPIEIDAEEARLNNAFHFGYETYGQDGPPAPLLQDPFDAQEFEPPRAEWLQRTTGQRVALPAEEFEQWGLASAEGKHAIVAAHMAVMFDDLEDPDTLQAAAQDPVQAEAQDDHSLPAPLTAPLLNLLQDPAQDDIDKYFRSFDSFDNGD